MIWTEKDNYPVQYKDILVFPEYFTIYGRNNKLQENMKKFVKDDINYYVVGVGQSYNPEYTTVLLLNKQLEIAGVRYKLSPFTGENVRVGTQLQCFQIGPTRRIGMVVCKEVLHTCIAEVFRMMKVNIVTVSIGSGDFWGMQRDSWIDQMMLFSTICGSPLVCACGATKQEGGINIIIEP
jgi:predicted amidohydrolase